MKKQQLSRNDYLSIIGFFGNTAIISKNHLAKIKKLKFEELLQMGMIRESICDAIYNNDDEKKKLICKNDNNDNYTEQFQALVREYGVLEDILQLEITKKYI